MGIASLVLGIISIIIGFIPFCGIIALIPAIVGLILGIVDAVKKSKKHLSKGVSIAGIILSALAVIIIIAYFLIVGIGVAVFDSANKESITSYAERANEDINDSLYETQTTLNQMFDNILDDTYQGSSYSRSVGESATIEDTKVTFNSVDKNFTDYYSFATVESGYKILKADFEIENLDTSSAYVSSYNFDCYADGVECSRFFSTEDSTFSEYLDSGKSLKGSSYWKIPTNAKEIEIVYSRDILSYNKITFVVE